LKESSMKAIVVYDSQYGNTEQIARAIARGIGGENDARAVRASEAPTDMSGLELLVVGSPTQGGRPTPPVQQYLAKLPSGGLSSVRVAAFDTRAKSWFTKLFGYAAARIAATLKSKGGTAAGPEQAFYVKGTKGPLVEDEIDRAMNWGKELASRR
jgi:flavodoxin I